MSVEYEFTLVDAEKLKQNLQNKSLLELTKEIDLEKAEEYLGFNKEEIIETQQEIKKFIEKNSKNTELKFIDFSKEVGLLLSEIVEKEGQNGKTEINLGKVEKKSVFKKWFGAEKDSESKSEINIIELYKALKKILLYQLLLVKNDELAHGHNCTFYDNTYCYLNNEADEFPIDAIHDPLYSGIAGSEIKFVTPDKGNIIPGIQINFYNEANTELKEILKKFDSKKQEEIKQLIINDQDLEAYPTKEEREELAEDTIELYQKLKKLFEYAEKNNFKILAYME